MAHVVSFKDVSEPVRYSNTDAMKAASVRSPATLAMLLRSSHAMESDVMEEYVEGEKTTSNCTAVSAVVVVTYCMPSEGAGVLVVESVPVAVDVAVAVAVADAVSLGDELTLADHDCDFVELSLAAAEFVAECVPEVDVVDDGAVVIVFDFVDDADSFAVDDEDADPVAEPEGDTEGVVVMVAQEVPDLDGVPVDVDVAQVLAVVVTVRAEDAVLHPVGDADDDAVAVPVVDADGVEVTPPDANAVAVVDAEIVIDSVGVKEATDCVAYTVIVGLVVAVPVVLLESVAVADTLSSAEVVATADFVTALFVGESVLVVEEEMAGVCDAETDAVMERVARGDALTDGLSVPDGLTLCDADVVGDRAPLNVVVVDPETVDVLEPDIDAVGDIDVDAVTDQLSFDDGVKTDADWEVDMVMVTGPDALGVADCDAEMHEVGERDDDTVSVAAADGLTVALEETVKEDAADGEDECDGVVVTEGEADTLEDLVEESDADAQCVDVMVGDTDSDNDVVIEFVTEIVLHGVTVKVGVTEVEPVEHVVTDGERDGDVETDPVNDAAGVRESIGDAE